MANTKSAKKSARQNEVRRQRNLARRTYLKTVVKKVVVAVEHGDAGQAQQLLKRAQAALARAKGKGVVHANTAARKVSRLARKINTLLPA